MATEYRLSHTANEIDRKLSEIDNLGKIKRVNGIEPDENGNVEIDISLTDADKLEIAAICKTLVGGGNSENLVEFSQMNPIVTQYMKEVNYSPDDYSTSAMFQYSYAETDYEKSHPVGYDVDITQSGELHLADDLSVIKMQSYVGTNTLYNAIPDVISHWWNAVDGNVTQNGTIRPTGQVRMINTVASNVRDLGGWPCDGGTVKYGKLFRGGLLSENDRAVLVNQCKVHHDLDLRGKSYNEGITVSPLGADIIYTCTDNHVWYSLDREDDWKTILRTIFTAVPRNEPVIFHCAAGADRTGTVACIVEAILGVSQPNLDKDFELTSFAIAPNARRRIDDNWKNLITEITSISVGETFRDKVINWVGYLGFTADEINAFRKVMIDGTPESITVESYTPGEPVEPDEPDQSYTNLAEPNTNNTTDFSIWCNNARIGSDGVAAAKDGYVSTNFVAVKPGDVVRFKNFKTERLCFYSTDKTPVNSGIARPNNHIVNSNITNVSGDANVTTDANAEPTEMTFTIVTGGSAVNIAFMRLSGHLTGDAEDVIITVNEEIVENGTIDPEVNYFNASTATLNHRVGSSGSLSAYDGIVVSDFIPVDSSMDGKVFRITGVSPIKATTYGYFARTAFYAPDTKAFLTGVHLNYDGTDWTGYVYPWSSHITTDTAYIRVSLVIKDNVAITADDIANIKITLE